MQPIYKYCLLFTAVFILAACQSNIPETATPTSTPPMPTQAATDSPATSLDGLWQTEGYGQLYEIEGDQFQMYAVTAVTCTPTLSGQIRPGGDLQEAWLDIHILSENGVNNIGVQVLPSTTPDEKQFIVDGIASHMNLRRLTDWPQTCQQPTPNTPQASFDAFWHTYAEHYPFFAMKGVDWQAVRDQYRSQITHNTSDAELFDIFTTMIAPLEDAHTWIQPIDLGASFEGQRPDPNPLTAADWQRTAEIVTNNYLQTPLTSYINGKVAFGILPNNIGYLRLNSFSEYDKDFWQGMDKLEAALDEIFSQSFDSLIIDIRPNTGGYDLYGLAIANRLTPTAYHAYTIQARNHPTDPAKWTDGQSIFVQPSERPSFHGPVTLLTSRYTVSAAETFTMALMDRTPEITRIGENTQGVFSVVLVHILPNGWWFGLQNERFLTADCTTYDGPGIPPHIAIPVYPPDELAAGEDKVLETALELLP